MEKWDLGYDVLRERNPGIILVRVSGYGQTGPEAHKAGYASVAEAASGLRHMNGFPGGPPPRLALSLGDSLAGMFAAQGALAALYRRTVTGEGQVVDVALTESCLAIQESTIPDYDVGGVVRGPSGTRLEGIAPSNIYPTADGSWVVIAANQDTVFRRLCAAMGRPELATDDRFATHVARGRNQDELDKVIGDWASERQPDEIIATLERGRGDQRAHQHRRRGRQRPAAAARGMIAEHYDERVGRPCWVPASCRCCPRHPGTMRTPGPARPGQHNHEVYAGLLGKSDAELESCARRECCERVTTHVDIREVSLRDGLQIEEPIPLSAKLELLEAVVATGYAKSRPPRSSPRPRCPRWPMPPNWRPNCIDSHGIEFSALVASRTAPSARSPPACGRSNTWCRPPTGTATPTSGRSTAGRPRRSPTSSRSPTTAAHRRGDHRHRLGLPV